MEPGSASEADSPIAVRRTEFDVGDLRGRDADVLAALVDEPQHVTRTGEGRFDLGLQLLAIGVVGKLDVELARGLGHSDAYVHRAHAIGRARSGFGGGFVWGRGRNEPSSDGDGGNRGVCGIDATTLVAHSVAVQRVAIFVYDGIQSLDVTGPAEVLAGASLMLPAEQGYEVTIVSLRGGTVSTQSAVRLDSCELDAWSRKHPGRSTR